MLETRAAQDGSAIRRRRECNRCEQRFATSETVDSSLAVVIGRDGHRAPFSRKTLADSLMLAGRSSLNEQARESITDQALAKLHNCGPAVTSAEISEAVLETLRERDTRTWIRYALMTQQPNSLADFAGWITTHLGESGGQATTPRVLVLKRRGSIEPFSLHKLERALQHATQGRPVEDPVCRHIASNIYVRVCESEKNTGSPVDTETIGNWAEGELAKYDALSALSYAILFRNLDSIHAVLSELHSLEHSVNSEGMVTK